MVADERVRPEPDVLESPSGSRSTRSVHDRLDRSADATTRSFCGRVPYRHPGASAREVPLVLVSVRVLRPFVSVDGARGVNYGAIARNAPQRARKLRFRRPDDGLVSETAEEHAVRSIDATSLCRLRPLVGRCHHLMWPCSKPISVAGRLPVLRSDQLATFACSPSSRSIGHGQGQPGALHEPTLSCTPT